MRAADPVWRPLDLKFKIHVWRPQDLKSRIDVEYVRPPNGQILSQMDFELDSQNPGIHHLEAYRAAESCKPTSILPLNYIKEDNLVNRLYPTPELYKEGQVIRSA